LAEPSDHRRVGEDAERGTERTLSARDDLETRAEGVGRRRCGRLHGRSQRSKLAPAPLRAAPRGVRIVGGRIGRLGARDPPYGAFGGDLCAALGPVGVARLSPSARRASRPIA